MVVAFLESVKYSGHLFPVAFLRIFLGWQYIGQAADKVNGRYLDEPHLAALINSWLHHNQSPSWYQHFLDTVVVPYWQIFAYLSTGAAFLVGFSFLAGFLVRPLAVLAALMSLNLLIIGDANQQLLHATFLAVHLTLAWLGAGRCVGVDYFFFKRNRGIWW